MSTRRHGDGALLQLDRVDAAYGMSRVLLSVSLTVARGEIVGVLGRNGAGRSTLLKAVMGLVASSGAIALDGQRIDGLAPFRIARLGVGYVPESRDVFHRLSVEKNLELGAKPAARAGEGDPPPWTVADMYRLFPPLEARARTLAGVLSGGEQQMLTLCRTLMGNPRLLLIDEPMEGLAPAVAAQVARVLVHLRERGLAILLVEQKLAAALAVAQRCLVMGRGEVVFEGTPGELAGRADVRREWLEL